MTFPPGARLSGITFVPNATSAFTISGNAFGLNGPIANSSANVQTINNAVTLAANGTITAATNIVLGGAISDGGSNYSLTLNGGKGVTLSGNNTFGGTLNINSGVGLTISAVANLGAGANISFGGSSLSTISATGLASNSRRHHPHHQQRLHRRLRQPRRRNGIRSRRQADRCGQGQQEQLQLLGGTIRFSNDTSDYTGDFAMGFGNPEFSSVANAGLSQFAWVKAPRARVAITLGQFQFRRCFRYVGAADSSRRDR